MQAARIRKEIQELKQAAKIEFKRAENDSIKNMTDEELQQAIDDDLAKLSFKSTEEYFEAAKKYCAENGLKISFNNDYQFQNDFFKILEDFETFDDFITKYGIFKECE